MRFICVIDFARHHHCTRSDIFKFSQFAHLTQSSVRLIIAEVWSLITQGTDLSAGRQVGFARSYLGNNAAINGKY